MQAPEYSFDEFAKHFDDVQAQLNENREAGYPQSFEMSIGVVHDYMKTVVADEKERRHKVGRFCLIMNYVSDHIHEFDEGDFAVYGSERVGTLASEHLLRAIHRFYTSDSLWTMKRDPTPIEVMELAATLRE